jgi:hypothetical protein
MELEVIIATAPRKGAQIGFALKSAWRRFLNVAGGPLSKEVPPPLIMQVGGGF